MIMTKNILFTLAIVAVFSSCKNRNDGELEPNFDIRSQELRNAILEYDSIVQSSTSKQDYVLTVTERILNDSVSQFIISYDWNTAIMQNIPVSLAKVNNKYVIFVGLGNHYGLLATNKSFQKEIARHCFPDDYRVLEKGQPINTYITNDDIEMQLTFCKGKLIKKWMTPGYR